MRKIFQFFMFARFQRSTRQFSTALQKSRKWLKTGFYIATTATVSYGIYGIHDLMLEIYNARHPPAQFQFDPAKKTLVVLGTGWGATSFLKDLETDDFNVVN